MDERVLLVAAFFLGMGLLALVRPGAVTGIFSTRLDHADGRNEVRAVYGGFGIAVALLLLVAAGRDDGFSDGLVTAIALALAGMAAGRAVGWVVERPTRLHPTVTFAVVELALAGLLARSL